MRPTVAIDLDGTLAEKDGPFDINHIPDPCPEARDFLTDVRQYADVLIYTCRCNAELNKPEAPSLLRKRVVTWLEEHDLPYGDVWIGQGKPIACAYVDDRAVYASPHTLRGDYMDVSEAIWGLCKCLVEEEDE